MSMMTTVTGFKPPDEKWKNMKAIWDSYEKAGLAVPDEIVLFFNDEPPDDLGVEVALQQTECCSEYRSNDGQGVEIEISKLPKDVKIIRFYNSW